MLDASCQSGVNCTGTATFINYHQSLIVCKLWFLSELLRAERIYFQRHIILSASFMWTLKRFIFLSYSLCFLAGFSFVTHLSLQGLGLFQEITRLPQAFPIHICSAIIIAAILCGCYCPLYFSFTGIKIKCSVFSQCIMVETHFSQKRSVSLVPLVICFSAAVFILSLYYEFCVYSNSVHNILRAT